MVSFYFVFIAVLLSGLGGRDQVLVAALTRAQGRRQTLIVIAVVISFITAAAAAVAAITIIPLLVSKARVFFAAMALLFAGVEALVIAPRAPAREPTHSLAAFTVVLTVSQLLDAARFLIFAIAVATNAPLPAGIAGAVAGGAMVFGAWLLPDIALHPATRIWRRIIGALLLLLGLLLALRTLEFV